MESKGWYSKNGRYQELQDGLEAVELHLNRVARGAITWKRFRMPGEIMGNVSYPAGPVPFLLREIWQEDMPGLAMQSWLLPEIPAHSADKIQEFVSKVDVLLLVQIKGRMAISDDGVHLVTSVFQDPIFPEDEHGYASKKVERLYVLNRELGMMAMDCMLLLHRSQLVLAQALDRFYGQYRLVLSRYSIPYFTIERR